MKVKDVILFLSCFVIIISVFAFQFAPKAGAFFIPDFLKSLTSPFQKTSATPTITVDVSPVKGGDVNKNSEIDAGDSVKFSYSIINPTKDVHQSISLKTNIDTKKLNTIRNVQGALSLDVKDNSIVVPNITVGQNKVVTISFEATVNLNKDTDEQISTEAELVDNSSNSIYKAEKKEITAKKMDQETFDKFVHTK